MPTADLTGARLDLDYTQEDERTITVTLVNDAGAAIDVSDDTFSGMLRKHAGDALATTLEWDVTDAATGVVVASVPSADLPDLVGTYKYDIKWTSTTYGVITVLKGNWYFEPAVTYA